MSYSKQQMQDYRGDSYQRLRSLYEQKFIRDGWQSFHQPFANSIKFKNNHFSSNEITQRANATHQQALTNVFGKYQQTLNHPNKSLLPKDQSKTPKKQIIIVCQYIEQSPKSFWLKDNEKNCWNERRKAFTSEVKSRKLLSDYNSVGHKKRQGQTIQMRQKDCDSHVSKNSTLIKMLQELKTEKKGRIGEKWYASLQRQPKSHQCKSNIIHYKQQKVISLLRKKDFKQNGQKTKSYRDGKHEKVQFTQHEAKIDGWNVIQHEY